MLDDILGINRRNVECIMALNRREDFRLVDDKLTTKEILRTEGIPAPALIGSTDSYFGMDGFMNLLDKRRSFALKPARGSGGQGIAVVHDVRDGRWVLADGSAWDRSQQVEHLQNILYGAFSLDNSMDVALAEELIIAHPGVACFTTCGLPDVRVILYQGMPVLSMLRVPTRKSGGKANLHAGGFAVAVDLPTGVTYRGWHHGRAIARHPETGAELTGVRLPYWEEILAMARRLYPRFPLGYMGVDFAIDKSRGPLILELNARPGLEIQNVTGRGLRGVLNGIAA